MLISKYNWRDAGLFWEIPGDGTAPEEPTPTPPATPPTTVPPASQEEEEAYDKPRALATIARLREESRNAKQMAKELADLKAAEQKRKDQELTEVQRAEKRAQEAEDARKALEAKYRTTAIDNAIRMAALAVGFADTDDAVKLVDRTSIDVGEDEQVAGAKEAVGLLAKAKPHLIKAGTPVAPDINATRSSLPSLNQPENLIEQKLQSGEYVPF